MSRTLIHFILPVMLVHAALSSCGQWQGGGASSAPPSQDPAGVRGVVSYKAACGMPSATMPKRVYLFPPLLSNARGIPVENMRPVLDANGEIIEWRSPASHAEPLRNEIARRLRERGYEVIGFMDLVESETAYSTIVVSSFYTNEARIENSAEGGFDRSISVSIRGSLFDSELDPASKKDIMRVDGLINHSSQRPVPSPLQRCFSESSRWFGDNVEGSVIIE